ncbi:MAG: iron-containing alcohol dehydrogenase [Pedobacter sp.]|nr:iron-containing alcohol dehydrogenase [Pedobacter sp.]
MNTMPLINKVDLSQYEDSRSIILITSKSAEKIAKSCLKNLELVSIVIVLTSDKKAAEALADVKHSGEVVYAVGGGKVMDVGRFLAHRWGLECICIPTMISSDAFLVNCTGLRNDGCVEYIPSQYAQEVFIDWRLIAKTPWRYQVSGCGDILSIYTAIYDWHEVSGHIDQLDDEKYNSEVAVLANSILGTLLSAADELKNESEEGLSTILSCLSMEVALCNIYGNSRPEEGGEHFFAYCIETKMNHFLHGEMVAFGVLLTAFIQGQKFNEIQMFMDDVRLNYKPVGLSKKLVVETLIELPAYVRTHKLRRSIYNDFSYEAYSQQIEDFLTEIGVM